MSQYPLKDKNNENILVIFKNNSIVNNDGDNKNNKNIGIECSMSDFIENIPSYMIDLPDKYNTELFIEVEAKMKEQAIVKLSKKYDL